MSSITSKDYCNAAIATLVPGSIAALGAVLITRKGCCLDYVKSVPKPSWAPQNIYFYSAMNMLALSPIGCASYMVYKYGGGFANKETRIALTTYGLTNLSMMAGMPAVLNCDLTALCGSAATTASLSAITAFLFYRINKRAGYMMVPLCLWATFYFGLFAYGVWCEKVDNKRK